MRIQILDGVGYLVDMSDLKPSIGFVMVEANSNELKAKGMDHEGAQIH